MKAMGSLLAVTALLLTGCSSSEDSAESTTTNSFPADSTMAKIAAKGKLVVGTAYEEMTAFALGLHQKLVATGVDPRSDDYFARVDGRLKQVFPEVFGESEAAPKKADQAKKPATVVASSSRSTGGKKTVKLTTTQQKLAEKFGLSHKQYAVEVLKLEI
jgi:ABC-type Fe3+-hydroxamate transport system substrate-binding protein